MPRTKSDPRWTRLRRRERRVMGKLKACNDRYDLTPEGDWLRTVHRPEACKAAVRRR